ncbi:hypothetical protein L6Q21_04305 [Sandaracinobacter sp. RS1-74]|uniref:phage tail sheath family protein n=1 Tax=Sandaracinobacteroides sayramensis TaxID=2913411 RepID=UPI001EDA5694|nr:hypothetical protein [Sandaracinobacteroides sayramensis]MCG2840203.1 hypothetical protein [Sandaracinobacteroides sayramensis]
MPEVAIEEMSPGPRPVEMLEMNRLAVIGRFARERPARLRRVEDIAAAGLPEGRVAAGLRAFFELGGREAVYLPSLTLAPVELPEGMGLVAAPEADGDWTLLAPLAEAARAAGAMLLLDAPWAATSGAKLQAWRQAGGADWKDAAAFAPWMLAADGGAVPPSMVAAGVVARMERRLGVWKAPSGVQATADPYRPAVELDERAQSLTSPLGVNLFRSFPGRGHLLWGGRTLSSDVEWRYLNVRRTVRMVERSLTQALRWAAFEADGELLCASARMQADAFLHQLFRQGAFQGQTPQQAYFLRCERTSVAEDDRVSGRLILEMGLALTRPGEFLFWRLTLPAAALD